LLGNFLLWDWAAVPGLVGFRGDIRGSLPGPHTSELSRLYIVIIA